MQCEAEECANNEQCEFELKVKEIKKEIQKEMGGLANLLATVDENPEQTLSKMESKLYKEYFGRLLKIEDNERKKAQRIDAMEKQLKKRVARLSQNISSKLLQREKDMRNKYQKMKRLFSLVTEIS
jgi:lipid A disaccharide synthetase